MTNNYNDNFSLFSWKRVELVWVILVITFIFLISYRQLITGEMKARDAQRKSDVELVARALNKYYSDYQIFPEADDEGRIISCGYAGSQPCIWGEDDILDEDEVVYLNGLPKDPQTWKGIKYRYTTDKDRASYKLYIHLEYKGDPAYKRDLTVKCGNEVECNWWVENM